MKSLLSKIRSPEPVVDLPEQRHDEEKKDGANLRAGEQTPATSDSESIDSDLQHGVKAAEATASVWPTSHLIMAYVMIWVINFVETTQQGMSTALTPYVTSSFQQHSLTAATSIMSNLIGGIFKLPLAKILDIWGRPQGFALMAAFVTIGLIMMAGCNNVQTYAAAQVFYWVGHQGVIYSISIFVADTSALRNRALMFAFASSPSIATAWIGGPIATRFLNTSGFRWGFGTFAIVMPIAMLPLFGLFAWNYRRAKKLGLFPEVQSNRTVPQSLKHYFIEFDVIGIILIVGGLALFLLPFSLYSYQSDGWKSPLIICLIIFGGLLLIAFALYEKYLAPVTFMPYELMTDRTVVGACVLAGTIFISFNLWDNYFQSFLQVNNGLSITEATYIGNIYTIGSCFWSLVVGALVRVTGRFKWLALYFGVPLTILGVGLMINFRQPDVNIGYIIMCQIFIAFAGGTLVICQQMAAMAAASHAHLAVVLAVENMFANVGGSIGSTIAAAIWTGVFPPKLGEFLPAEEQENIASIYADLNVQLSYEPGTQARDAINKAYGEAQRYMLIAATAVLVIAVVATAMWRDIRVKDFKQVKGRVI